MRKHSIPYLCLSASLLLLAGCDRDGSSSAAGGEPVTVDFTVAGIADYGESDPIPARSATGTPDLVSAPPSPVTVTMPFDGDYSMEVTLTPDVPIRSRAAETRTALGEGIRYRVLAYDVYSGYRSYAGYADYVISGGSSSLVKGGLNLTKGTYNFSAYSYNNSDEITDTPESTTAITVNANDKDYLHWEQTVNINDNIVLPISFKHVLARMTVIFDATEYGSSINKASCSLLNMESAGQWTIGTSTATSSGSYLDIPVTLNTSDGSAKNNIWRSDPLSMLPISDKEITLNISATFANGKTISDYKALFTSRSFKPNYSYTCTVRFKPFGIFLEQGGLDIDGNSYGGGNCWVLPKTTTQNQRYMFDASKEGQTDNPVGTTNKTGSVTRGAKVVWEDTDGLIAIQPTYKNGRITFGVTAGKTGNAIIAATDGNDFILWSWHIWVVGDNSFMNPDVTSNTYMDRNLGAMSNTPGDTLSYGLFYQWGRKDPLRRESGNTMPGPQSVASSVQNPDKLIFSDYVGNWCTEDLDFWGSEMIGCFNPCPKGWTLPLRRNLWDLSIEGLNWNKGYTFNGNYFPAAGSRYKDSYDSSDTEGCYWSNRGEENLGDFLELTENELGRVGLTKSRGYSVRCVRE